MNQWLEVYRASLQDDLKALILFFQQQGIVCKVVEHQGQQQVLILDQYHREALLIVEQWQQDELPIINTEEGSEQSISVVQGTHVFLLWRQFPLTLLLLFLSLLGFFIVKFEWASVVFHWFSFQDFTIISDQLLFTPIKDKPWQIWRWISPVFLHFNTLHIVFNGLWLLELGRRVESSQGSGRLLFIFLLVAISSNFSQYYLGVLSNETSFFGGMSGVIYGLLGYCWIYTKRRPIPALILPQGLVGFMLFWLVICLFGLVTTAGFGRIANGAHVSGLIVGMLLAWFLAARDAHSVLA